MSSYLSNILTHTTSKYNSLRRTLLSSEDDGDTEDDTHICRVLRAYYTEKGRPFPGWLPPDPNDKRAVTPQPYGQQSGYFTSAGGKSQYAGTQSQQAGQRASLSDLWDPPAAAQNNGPMQPQSLRNARRPMIPPASQSSSSLAPPQARPLPSQRAGSYQSINSQASSRPNSGMANQPSPPPTAGGPAAGSAQERLKARLWGGRASPAPPSPGPTQTSAPNPYDQPRAGGGASYNSGGNPYDGGGNRRYGRG